MAYIPDGIESIMPESDSVMEPKGKHKAVRVFHGTLEADVDEAIAPLILEMWKAGVYTYQSCQGNPEGWVWIQFADQCDLEKFLSLVGRHAAADDHMHRRMRFDYNSPTTLSPGQWCYRLIVEDLSIDFEESEDEPGFVVEIGNGPSKFALLFCLHFPSTDLPVVLTRLIAHNQLVACTEPVIAGECC